MGSGPTAADDELLRRRLTAQRLTGGAERRPADVAGRLLAIQSQDLRGARLAIRARSRGLSGADVDRALTQERSLVVCWLGRGTLHLVGAEDYEWLHPLLTPPLRTPNGTRLSQTGVSASQADRGVAVIDRALSDEGPLERAALGERLRAAGIPVDGQALVHLLLRATLDGVCVRGPVVAAAGGGQAYARVADWLRDAGRDRFDRAASLAELALRFLRGHGPSDAGELARWSGLPLRDARAGLSAIAGRLHERGDGLVELRERDRLGPLPPPRLLGAFEPLVMTPGARAQVLGDRDGDVISGGIFRGFALVEGRAAAVWRFAGAAPAIEALRPLDAAVAMALEADADAVRRFLGR